jgi:hypothetical protein
MPFRAWLQGCRGGRSDDPRRWRTQYLLWGVTQASPENSGLRFPRTAKRFRVHGELRSIMLKGVRK